MDSKEVLLEINNLSYAYEDKDALRDVSLKVFKGEKIAVMGSNGAGKSTLFLNINGVLESKHGQIIYKGQVYNKKNYKNLRKNVGFVFQDPDSQLIAPNVKAEISFGPINMGMSKHDIQNNVEKALKYMELLGYEMRPPHYLSGGEKKRVTIADILAMDTEILLFDEPMSSLDPVNSDIVEEILNRLSQEEKTIIVATHDVNFAYRFADRIIVMSQGEILASSIPDEIFANQELLNRANLKKPDIMIVFEKLIKAGLVDKDAICPRCTSELTIGG